MTGEPTWFEIGVADVEKGRAFYGALLGWTLEAPPEGEGAVIGTPTIGGGLHGGDEGTTAMTFFRVDDLDAALEKLEELGGARTGYGSEGPPEQTKWGRLAICRDDQGSLFGLHEPGQD